MGDYVIMIDARTGSDFTLDAVWAGLVQKFGSEFVIDWPPADKHREGIPKITGNIDLDYGSERRTLCYTRDHKKIQTLSIQQINGLIKNGQVKNFIVDEREESFRYYLQTWARFHKVPVIVVAGHDRFWNSSPQKLFEYYKNDLAAMFLDNWKQEYDSIQNAFPMSYAINFDHMWSRPEYKRKKKYDLCFMGYNSHGDRGVIIDHLINKYGHDGNCLFVEKRHNTVECFRPKSDYFQLMSESKICINLKGAAECGKALRFYEIPFVGSFMLSQRFPAVQVEPFIEGKHCMYFSTIEELDEKISWALSHEKEREIIADAGYYHMINNHTSLARVDYMYRKMNEQNIIL